MAVSDKKIVVVMPAYNAAKTLEETYKDIPKDIVDEIILVDDARMFLIRLFCSIFYQIILH